MASLECVLRKKVSWVQHSKKNQQLLKKQLENAAQCASSMKQTVVASFASCIIKNILFSQKALSFL